MVVSLSAVVLLALAVFLLLRSGRLRILPGLAAVGLADLLAQINF